MADTDKGFDAEGFYGALSATVRARDVNWKRVSQETGVSPTTLTRMAQGRKPDAASLAVLAAWSGLDIKNFVEMGDRAEKPEALAMAMTYFRADPNLDENARRALEAVITSAYKEFRRQSTQK